MPFVTTRGPNNVLSDGRLELVVCRGFVDVVAQLTGPRRYAFGYVDLARVGGRCCIPVSERRGAPSVLRLDGDRAGASVLF